MQCKQPNKGRTVNDVLVVALIDLDELIHSNTDIGFLCVQKCKLN